MLESHVLSQFPRHIREKHETFVRFVQAYYKWMEMNRIDPMMVRDIDSTLDAFVDELIREVASELPDDTAVDKRLLLKNIHSFYTAKGSSESFKLLFRILYDLDAELYYPSRRLLRPSDGRWNVRKQVLLRPVEGPIEDLEDVLLYKDPLNYVSVRQPVVINANDEQLWTFQVVLENSNGEILPGDFISTNTGSFLETKFEALRQLDNFVIVNRGSQYIVGDVVTVTGGNEPAFARVTKTTKGIFKGQASYTFTQSTGILRIEFDTPHALLVNTPLNLTFGATFPSGAYQVDRVINPLIVECDLTLELGSNSSGTVDVIDNTTGGQITEIQWVNKEGIVVDDPNAVSVSVSSVLGTGAQVTCTTAAIAFFDQGYTDVRGRLSENYIVLHDGKVFQAYSYIVRVAESITFWRDIVKKLVHPAGMYLLAEIMDVINIPTPQRNIIPTITIQTITSIDRPTVQTFINTQLVVSSASANTNRSIAALRTHIPNTLPSFQGRSIYDTDALYAGITNSNYVGTVNEGYWYEFFGTEYAPIYYNTYESSDNAYTGAIVTKPPLTRWAEFLSSELLDGACGCPPITMQDYVYGAWDIAHVSYEVLSTPEQKLSWAIQLLQDVASLNPMSDLTSGQGTETIRVKTYNAPEAVVKIYSPWVEYNDIQLSDVAGVLTLSECGLADGV